MAGLPEKVKAKGTLATIGLSGAAAMMFAQTVAYTIVSDLILSVVVFGIGVLVGKFVWK